MIIICGIHFDKKNLIIFLFIIKNLIITAGKCQFFFLFFYILLLLKIDKEFRKTGFPLI